MNIAITGAKGMLASALIQRLREHHIIPIDLPETDITIAHSVEQALLHADFVYHCAAYTNVDKAETDADAAMAVNVTGTEHIARFCGTHDIPLVYISTDYVFGEKALHMMKAQGPIRAWKETDAPAPDGVYARSKHGGEQAVLRHCKKYFIARTAWLYGHNGKNFVATMLALAAKGDPVTVVNDQTGSPTYTGDLADALVKLLDIKEYGIYHLTNQGETTWYGFAQEIFKQAGVTVTLIPCTTEEFPRPTKRPVYSVLENAHWQAIGQEPLPHWSTGLQKYLGHKGI